MFHKCRMPLMELTPRNLKKNKGKNSPEDAREDVKVNDGDAVTADNPDICQSSRTNRESTMATTHYEIAYN